MLIQTPKTRDRKNAYNRERFKEKKAVIVGYTLVQDHRYPGDMHYSLAIEPVGITEKQKESVLKFGGIVFKTRREAEVFAEISMGDGKVPWIHGRFPNKLIQSKRLYVPTNDERVMAGFEPIIRDLPTSVMDSPLSGRKGLELMGRKGLYQRRFNDDDGRLHDGSLKGMGSLNVASGEYQT